MEIVLLGTGSPIPDPNRAGPATLLKVGEGEHVLVDAGRGCTLPTEAVARLLTDRTRLVAVTRASNALGTIVDARAIAHAAAAAGALSFVDAVHYAPHGELDVQDMGCDFLVASAYKFYGPHTGLMYGRHDLLSEIDVPRVRLGCDGQRGREEEQEGERSRRVGHSDSAAPCLCAPTRRSPWTGRGGR